MSARRDAWLIRSMLAPADEDRSTRRASSVLPHGWTQGLARSRGGSPWCRARIIPPGGPSDRIFSRFPFGPRAPGVRRGATSASARLADAEGYALPAHETPDRRTVVAVVARDGGYRVARQVVALDGRPAPACQRQPRRWFVLARGRARRARSAAHRDFGPHLLVETGHVPRHPEVQVPGPHAEVQRHLGDREALAAEQVDLPATHLDRELLRSPAPTRHVKASPGQPALHLAQADAVDAGELLGGATAAEHVRHRGQDRGISPGVHGYFPVTFVAAGSGCGRALRRSQGGRRSSRPSAPRCQWRYLDAACWYHDGDASLRTSVRRPARRAQ